MNTDFTYLLQLERLPTTREEFGSNATLCSSYTHPPSQPEEKIRPQQQEQQLAFTYNLWQGNIEAGSLRSCPNGFSPPSSRRKVVTCEKCNNLGSLSLTCSRWTTETGRITEEENHYRKSGAIDFPTPFGF